MEEIKNNKEEKIVKDFLIRLHHSKSKEVRVCCESVTTNSYYMYHRQ